MAYDRALQLRGWDEFFKTTILEQRRISQFNYKVPETVVKCIRYEYIKDPETSKGLFSLDNIMAFIFVFEYKVEYDKDNKQIYNQSLEDMIYLADSINQSELSKSSTGSNTVKCFVCNKYPGIIMDYAWEARNREIVQDILNKDNVAEDYFKMIKRIYKNDE
jgi:hypothetical protein